MGRRRRRVCEEQGGRTAPGLFPNRSFPTDRLLRSLDPPFRIKRRPARGPAVWERFGEEYTEDEALAFAKPEDLERAMRAEEAYFAAAYR